MATELTKQEIMNRSCDVLSIDHLKVSNGSTEPRTFLDAVARAIGLDPTRHSTKQLLAENIARHLGQKWDSTCDSREQAASGGGTVTAEGLARILQGLKIHAVTENKRFELRVRARLLTSEFAPEAPEGNQNPTRTIESVATFSRSAEVAAWVLRFAAGCCEFCGNPAPFKTPLGTAFLEVHHIKPLAMGGADTVMNTVALCPNCHRAAHYSTAAGEITAALEAHIRTRFAN